MGIANTLGAEEKNFENVPACSPVEETTATNGNPKRKLSVFRIRIFATKLRIFDLFLFCFILFSSVLGFFHYQDGTRIPIEKMQKLEAGMSREDVKQILGEPSLKREFVDNQDNPFASWYWDESCNVPYCPICFLLSNYMWFPESLRKRRQYVSVDFSDVIYRAQLDYNDRDAFDEPEFR